MKVRPGGSRAANTMVTALALAAGAVAAVATVAAVAAAAITVRMARTVVTPVRRKEEDLRVLAVSTTTVTLTRTIDSLTPGKYSLWFDQGAGHARIGEIIEVDDTSVTRHIIDLDFGTLRVGSRARISGWFYIGPRELGFPHENVDVATPIGPAPAWLIPAAVASGDWVIQVHGRAVRRPEGLRAVSVFRDAGFTTLLISYRNDEDAPDSDDNRYSLGDSEWLDVEAAIGFALSRGARRIVLMGWSMGGATVLQAVTRTIHRGAIVGIVLDSPVIDWVSVLDYQGAQSRVPEILRRAALGLISRPWGQLLTGQAEPIDLNRLDFVRRASVLTQPILLMHSDQDGYVPADASKALAAARSDIVTFESFTTARHARLWNYDSDRWNSTISRWLAANVPAVPSVQPAAVVSLAPSARPSARTARSSRPPEVG